MSGSALLPGRKHIAQQAVSPTGPNASHRFDPNLTAAVLMGSDNKSGIKPANKPTSASVNDDIQAPETRSRRKCKSAVSAFLLENSP